MSRYTSLNWRDQTTRWEWSEAYAGWLALAEQHRLEEECKRTARNTATTELASPPK
jgi:hypothetical protein